MQTMVHSVIFLGLILASSFWGRSKERHHLNKGDSDSCSKQPLIQIEPVDLDQLEDSG